MYKIKNVAFCHVFYFIHGLAEAVGPYFPRLVTF